jgi:hypothetical protein
MIVARWQGAVTDSSDRSKLFYSLQRERVAAITIAALVIRLVPPCSSSGN